MNYDDFNIRLEPKGDDTFKVSVETPAGNDSSEVRLTRSVDELIPMLQALGQSLRGAEPEGTDGAWATDTRGILYRDELVAQPTEIGKTLYRDLFVGAAESKFNQSLGHVKGRQKGLRIKLHIDPEDPDVARAASLPWELLCHPDMGDQPLSLSTETPLVRYLNSPRPLNLAEFHPPLRILVVVSNPQGVRQLDLEAERKSIETGWGNRDDVEVHFLQRATVQSLSDELARREYHILHYMGHGDFDPNQGVGVLLMETDDGMTDPVDGRTLGVSLQDARSLRMVFVNACNTAQATQSDEMDPYAGIAAGLVMSGVPAVVAMQFPISDRAAIIFTGTLYPRLAQGLPLDTAVAEARKAIRLADRHSVEWATPVLFMSASDGNLFTAADDAATTHGNIRRAGTDQIPQAEPATPKSKAQAISGSFRRYGIVGIAVAAIAIAAIVIGNMMSGSGDEQQLALPTTAEYARYVTAANASMVSENDLEAITNNALRMALQIKMFAETQNQQSLDSLFEEVNDLASRSDAEATVTLYLASRFDNLSDHFAASGVTTQSLVPGLMNSSDNGYGLATFLYAERLQESLRAESGPEGIDQGNEQFLEYCGKLRLAVAQGLTEIAMDRADVDQCVL